jgi:serine phosphatase RsbU (regulator of sigma subunit)
VPVVVSEGQRVNLRKLLAAVEEVPPVDAVDALAAELAEMIDAHHVSLLIANFSGNAVVRLSHVTSKAALISGHNERVESLTLTDSIYQHVLFTQNREVVPVNSDWLVLLPVTERGDTIGILELCLSEQPDADTLDYLVAAAHALAYVLIASRRHTDLFEWAQRNIPFSLAAEIQRRLLPSAYTAEGGSFTISGWLEPAHDAGGDTFDYSVDREFLYASITDAMGHSTQAALLATLAVGSLRNSRRALASPAEQALTASNNLASLATEDQFVTGQLIRIRLADGATEIVNAGHPAPYLVRAGQAAKIDVASDAPLGVQTDQYAAQTLQLQPGDRLLLVTDGYLERNAVEVDIAQILVTTVERHPRQIVQELARNVLEATGGRLLDDATAVCIDWYGLTGDRHATGGASPDRATTS